MRSILDFSSLFELSITYNFLYAVIDDFENKVKLLFIGPFEAFHKKILLDAAIVIEQAIGDGKSEDLLHNRTATMKQQLKDHVPNGIEDSINKVSRDVKGGYLGAGFFSLVVLVFGGLAEKNYKFLSVILIMGAVLLIYELIVVCRMMIKSKKTWGSLFIPMFITSIALFTANCFYWNSEKYIPCEQYSDLIIGVALVSVGLPLFLQLFGIVIIYARAAYRLKKLKKQFCSVVERIGDDENSASNEARAQSLIEKHFATVSKGHEN